VAERKGVTAGVVKKLQGLVLALGKVQGKLSAKAKGAYETLKDAVKKGTEAETKTLVPALNLLLADKAVTEGMKKAIHEVIAAMGYAPPKPYYDKEYGKAEESCSYRCPKCGFTGSPDAKGNCPKCGAKMEADYGTKDEARSNIARSATAHPHGEHVIYCPECGHEEVVKAGVKARERKCPKCGARMRAKETGERRTKEARFIESGQIVEAVEETEGLVWKAVLIEAGMSVNRRRYRPEVLRPRVSLFDGVRVFIDHPTPTDEKERPERSTRDIVGWISGPAWDESVGEQGAVIGSLHLLESNPMSNLVREAYERGKPDLYTLSIYGKGEQRLVRENGQVFQDVQSISKISSVDLVTEGAAGGRLVELMASIREEEERNMLESLSVDEILEVRPDLAEMLRGKSNGGEETEAPSNEELDRVQAELASLKEAMAVSRCEAKLHSRLAEASLPDAMKDSIRSRFSGRTFEDGELSEAIVAATKLLEDISDEQERKEPKDRRPKILIVRDEGDKFVDALTATILGEKFNEVDGFRSIQQAYCRFHGLDFWDVGSQQIAASMIKESINYDPILSGVLLSEAVTWSYVFGVSLNRILVKDYQIPAFDEWQLIVSDTRTLKDFRAQKIERIGYYGALPTVAAGGPYQEGTPLSEKEGSYTPAKRGLLESWTWEDAINDDLGALRKIPRRLALAAKITLYQFVFDFIDDNATCSYDSVDLFHADHGNLSTNELTSANLTSAKIAMKDQTALSSSITFLAAKPKYMLVPNELETTALQLRNSKTEVTSDKDATVANPHEGTFDVIPVSYWTDDDKWILVADPKLIPTIEVGFLGGKREPELFTEAPQSGSHFTADKVVCKVRFVFGGAIVDHRGFYGNIPS